MSDNQNPEVHQPADELDDKQLNEVAGGDGPQQVLLLPYIEQDNIYKASGGQKQSKENLPMEPIPLDVTKGN